MRSSAVSRQLALLNRIVRDKDETTDKVNRWAWWQENSRKPLENSIETLGPVHVCPRTPRIASGRVWSVFGIHLEFQWTLIRRQNRFYTTPVPRYAMKLRPCRVMRKSDSICWIGLREMTGVVKLFYKKNAQTRLSRLRLRKKNIR